MTAIINKFESNLIKKLIYQLLCSVISLQIQITSCNLN